MQFHHINHVWAHIIIDSLIAAGVKHVCIAPGSRSTPLTLAAAHSALTCHVHFDERGLGFMALGLAKQAQAPVAIITTSGTAVANLYPAVIEASLTQVPLVVLSADRPPELLHCGANQAITQQQIFADYPRYQTNIPTPTETVPALWVQQQLEAAFSHIHLGPLHINCMFAEPLYPNGELVDFSAYLSSLCPFKINPVPRPVPVANRALPEAIWPKQGIVIVGQLDSAEEAWLAAEFAAKMNWPLLPDPQSQCVHPAALYHYDLLLKQPSFIAQLDQAGLIVQFGARLVSKRLLQFITRFSAEKKGQYWQVDPAPIALDPTHTAARFYCTVSQFIEQYPPIENGAGWLKQLQASEQQLSLLLAQYFNDDVLSELAVAYHLPTMMPADSVLFIGNSMPIRLIDMLVSFSGQSVQVITNRGASGIDGIVASAVGVALADKTRVVTLLIGDLSLLHDLNSLALLQAVPNLIIVLLNNDGGAIFNQLPVPASVQQRFYQLPHATDFQASCAQFQLDHQQPRSITAFSQAYNRALAQHHASLIEVRVPSEQTRQLLQQLDKAIDAHLK